MASPARNPRATSTGTLRGAVATAAPDGQSYNVPGASLKLKSDTDFGRSDRRRGEAISSQTLSARRRTRSKQPFKDLRQRAKTITIRAGETSVENIKLEVADVTATVTVTSSNSGRQAYRRTKQRPPLLSNRPIFKRCRCQTSSCSMRCRWCREWFVDRMGRSTMNGARASQSAMTVNSANVTDPVTGDFAINLAY